MQHIEDVLCHYSTVYVARSSPTDYEFTASSTKHPDFVTRGIIVLSINLLTHIPQDF